MSGSTTSSNVGIRTYGRVVDPVTGASFWTQVTPDSNGWPDSVYLTALIQAIKLNWGESPFYGDWGIPARPSVNQQIPPDYAMALMQARFAQFFMSLQIARVPNSSPPSYNVQVQFHNGAAMSVTLIPQAMLDGFGLAVTDGHGYTLSTGQMKSGIYVAV